MATILVVDDEATIRFAIAEVLSSEHEVMEAANGAEGLLIFKSRQPDLIITDCNMPVMAGEDFVRVIRSVPNNVKIIVLSAGLCDPREQQRLLAAGADLTLEKTINIATLKKAINDLLE